MSFLESIGIQDPGVLLQPAELHDDLVQRVLTTMKKQYRLWNRQYRRLRKVISDILLPIRAEIMMNQVPIAGPPFFTPVIDMLIIKLLFQRHVGGSMYFSHEEEEGITNNIAKKQFGFPDDLLYNLSREIRNDFNVRSAVVYERPNTRAKRQLTDELNADNRRFFYKDHP
jgi:hypothetical protein